MMSDRIQYLETTSSHKRKRLLTMAVGKGVCVLGRAHSDLSKSKFLNQHLVFVLHHHTVRHTTDACS